MNEVNMAETEKILELVSFNLGNEEFAIEIKNVNEILKMLEITSVPNSPFGIEGIANIRGKIVPILDSRKKMNMPVSQQTNESRIIVVEIKDKTVGFIVDKVKEVIRISENELEQLPDIVVSGVESEFITSIIKIEDRLVIIFDLSKILNLN